MFVEGNGNHHVVVAILLRTKRDLPEVLPVGQCRRRLDRDLERDLLTNIDGDRLVAGGREVGGV